MNDSAWREAFEEVRFRLRSGVRALWNWPLDKLLDRQRDAAFGIDSWQRHELEEFGLADRDRVPYQASSYRDLQELFASLGIGEQDVFLDLGAGLGRVVCVAGQYPFRSIIGVELSENLSRQAVVNVDRARARLVCRDVRIVHDSAEDYFIPPEVTVIYLFNPFRGAVLIRVLENIRRSMREHPRPLRLIFYGTASSGAFRISAASQSWLALSACHRLPTGAIALIYRANTPSQE